MTHEEEALFRQAAREALALDRDVLMVGSDELPLFSVVQFDGGPAVAIVIPDSWTEIDGMEERCHGILRQESKALAGLGLD